MSAETAVAAVKPIDEVRTLLVKMESEFINVLPSHITPERFQRVALTSIQSNPDLLLADRKTLISSCMLAAQDGLLPDGREAAFVIFNKKVKTSKGDEWIKAVQYMPMVFGITKKCYNSGEVLSLTAHLVYERDEFTHFVDENGEHFKHTPNLMIDDRGRVGLCYAVAKLKNGTTMFEPLTHKDVEKIRAASKAKNSGPWVDWWEEMAKKSAIRRLSKKLPMAADAIQVIQRVDELYDFNEHPAGRQAGEIAPPRPAKPSKSTLKAAQQEEADRYDEFKGAVAEPAKPKPKETVIEETGEVVEDEEPVTTAENTPQNAEPEQEQDNAPQEPEREEEKPAQQATAPKQAEKEAPAKAAAPATADVPAEMTAVEAKKFRNTTEKEIVRFEGSSVQFAAYKDKIMPDYRRLKVIDVEGAKAISDMFAAKMKHIKEREAAADDEM